MDAVHMAIWDSTIVNGRIIDGVVSWTAAGAVLIGRGAEPFKQTYGEFLDLVIDADRERVLATMQAGVDRRGTYELEYCITWPDGSVHWIAARAQIVCDEHGAPARTLGIVWDVTLRVTDEIRTAERDRLAETTLFAIADGVLRTDTQGKVTFINRAAEALTGWGPDGALGREVDRVMPLVDGNTGESIEHPVRRCLRQQQSIGVSTHTQLTTRENKRIDIEDAVAPIWSPQDELMGTVIVFRDVSHERRLAHQISWQATHDALTGLINRVEFETRVADALRLSKDEGQVHTLLYMDLDRFKVVNDTSGHAAGDILLKLLARMLHEKMRDSDILARLGGDELGALLLHCPMERALPIAEGLRRAVNEFRFIWDDHTYELGVSIGIVEVNEESVSTTELLIAADQACYLAKEQGRNRIHVYRETDQMLAQRKGEMKWVSRLHDAFDKQLFQLFAMPIVNLQDVHDRHDEILIRIVQRTGELTMPGAFIPAAERYDLMYQIDRWVVDAVCAYIDGEGPHVPGEQPAQKRPHEHCVFSINLSGASISEPGFGDYILKKFEEYHIRPAQICFEITETAVIANLPKAQSFMARLKALGCRFSLDDFGCGLSSFGYLKALPVDYLKIDGVFVHDIAHNPVNRAMVRAINEVGHVMNIKTVAEYVEDETALQTVREIGIDYAQGYAVGGVRLLTPDL
jgi:diguanylate cyclase (GGDEF)-like protein/PAS domain S-box-containing protein